MRLSLFFVLLLSIAIQARAQLTTSAVSGHITDTQGEDIPGATVQMVYKPTNTTFGVTTNTAGRFTLANLPPGGPYELTTSFVGKQTEKREVHLILGQTTTMNFTLADQSQTLAEVVVVGINENATEKYVTNTTVGKEQIQSLPTLARSFSDFTRLTPQASNNSFAGTNFRYNNISLDGAINNDAIGFSPSLGGISGTANQPGSSTRTNSFSLDAIQEVQVQIAPYDVSLGNFTGGSINAVSRSGSNEVTGSVYGFGRANAITGKYKGADKVGNGSIPSGYHDYQTGFRVGFPIIKDKLFFFTNEEITNNSVPVLFPANAPGYFMTQAIADQITQKLESMPATVYNPAGGYNPGATGAYSVFSKSAKFFNRLDWKLGKHTLSIRNNSIVSSASNLERSSQEFQFGSYDFVQHNRNISTVAELKSRLGNSASNSLIVGYTDIKDYRDPNSIFPQIQINGINGGHVLLGTNREAGVFNMRQRTWEVTDNYKVFLGSHNLTFGTHNEFYKINYGFINSWNGRFDYANLAAFLADNPSRMRAIYDPTDNSLANAKSRAYDLGAFNVAMTSLYAQDEWTRGKLNLTYGLRMDLPIMSQGPVADARAKFPDSPANLNTTYGYGTPVSQISNKVLGNPYVSPRLGFNYDLKGDQSVILRGGSGLFTGRIPFAWFGYTYINNGTSFNAMDLNPPAAGTAIPTSQGQFGAFAAANGSKNRTELDLMDKNLSMPRMWRSNLAVDFNLPNDFKLSLEGIYTKVVKDIQIKQINLKDSAVYASYDVNKQQPLYASGGATANRVSNDFSSVYLITNTNQGYRYQLTAKITKSYAFGLNYMVAYTYGQSKDILNGIRNSPESGWQTNQALNPNNPGLAYSNFDIRHRIVSSVQYKKTWGQTAASYISLIYTSQSGSPYSYAITSSNKLTANGQQADLFYVPKANGENPYNLSATDLAAFNQYIDGDKYLSSRRGQFTERNGARTPWNNQLDLRLMQDFYVKVGRHNKTNTVQVTFDVINLSNMIDKKWGVYYFTPNTINSSVDPGLNITGRTITNGVANVTATYTTPTAKYSIDQFSSRWQAQLGLRYSF